MFVWVIGILIGLFALVMMIPSPVLGTIVLLSILFYFDLIIPIIIGAVVILAACMIYALIDEGVFATDTNDEKENDEKENDDPRNAGWY